jgi:hypothetical protein
MTSIRGPARESAWRHRSVRIWLLGPAGWAVFCSGCQPTVEYSDFAAAEMELAPLEAESQEMPPASPQAATLQPRLIRSGTARIEVEDLDAALAAAAQLAMEVQGYVAGSQLNEGREGARTASLVLRLPSAALPSVVDRLESLGRVLSVSVNASDVSREYFDVETRLAVKEETVTRLRQLATRGGDLEDVLAAERELGRALTELESLKGQIRYYDQRIAESDLQLALIEPGAVVTSGAFRPVVEAFRNATQVFAQSVGYLVYILVFIAPWVVVALLFWPALSRWRRMRGGSGESEAA